MSSTLAIITPDDLRYPAYKHYSEGMIAVGDGHRLHYMQFGNPKGVPVVVNHGGPGEGLNAKATRLFDFSHFRVIVYDQRGCGKSKPHFADQRQAALKHNNPQKLVADIEVLRRHLKIHRWHVYGGSWGSTLSLLYATTHPGHVRSLLVHGIYLHRLSDIDWYINRMGLFFPEAEAKLLADLPSGLQNPTDRLNFLATHIVSGPKAKALKVADVQGRFELAAIHFEPKQQGPVKQSAQETRDEKRMAITLGALECHFMLDHSLHEDWYKTAAAKKAFKLIKTINVLQGRYDIVCPPKAAYELVTANPHMDLTILPLAGHASGELAMTAALVNATEAMKAY